MVLPLVIPALYLSPNLTSACHHPEVVDEELAQEIAAGRILGPLQTDHYPTSAA